MTIESIAAPALPYASTSGKKSDDAVAADAVALVPAAGPPASSIGDIAGTHSGGVNDEHKAGNEIGARERRGQNGAAKTANSDESSDAAKTDGQGANARDNGISGLDPRTLTEEQLQQVREMQKRDREVRVHESAHLAVASAYARGAVQYTYAYGPDGKRYAVGGEVNIDTAPVPNDPEATLRKARALRNAALAPAEPSDQDRSVAVAAMNMAAQAQAEILAKKMHGDLDVTQPRAPDQPANLDSAPATDAYRAVAHTITPDDSDDERRVDLTA